MSRTYRRKGKEANWAITKWTRSVNGGNTGYWKLVDLIGKEKKAAISRYHSDNGCGDNWMRNAPKDFRRDIEQIKRAKDKALVIKIMQTQDYEDYSFNPRRKDAGWLWW